MNTVERTLVIIKPDAWKRNLAEMIRDRIGQKGFHVRNELTYRLKDPISKMHSPIPENRLEEHYIEHYGKSYYSDLLEFMKSGPITILLVEGYLAIAQMRLMAGATDPLKRDQGSIRGQWSDHHMYNLIHTSDSPESARREIELWFGKDSVLPTVYFKEKP
jgi:nucleoside-diphosphate kinase